MSAVEPSDLDNDDASKDQARLDRSSAAARSPEAARAGPGHTSIVYFHGMGTPRRYEELTRVLDTLDRYAEAQNDPGGLGRLRAQLVKLEPSRAGGDDPIAYIRFFRLLWSNGGQKRVGAYRLYESFWSPAAAGGISALNVLAWLLARVFNPFVVLFNPWRAHQRLKLTFLSRLAFDQRRVPAHLYKQLQRHYRAFEGMDRRRQYPNGYFSDFLKILESSPPGDVEDLVRLAKLWRKRLRRAQYEVLGLGVLVGGFLFGAATLGLAAAVRLLAWMGFSIQAYDWLNSRTAALDGWILAVSFIGIPVIVYFGRAFFRNFLSDVVFWTTTFEKDTRHFKRREILKACEATLRHVLADPQCARVVVVGHSLGTAIAHETLLNLGRRARAEAEAGLGGSDTRLDTLLGKLSHFITFGSPIDRISYFFSLHYSRYHRFNRVVDDLAGTTADTPFRRNKVRALQWINVRDATDPVASRLFAPRSPLPNRDEIVEIEVSNTHMPDPVGAHTGYFDAELSAKILFDACILDRKQVQAQDGRPAWSRRFGQVSRLASLVLVAITVACLAAGAGAFWAAAPQLALISQTTFLTALGLIGLIAAIGRFLDTRWRLTLPA